MHFNSKARYPSVPECRDCVRDYVKSLELCLGSGNPEDYKKLIDASQKLYLCCLENKRQLPKNERMEAISEFSRGEEKVRLFLDWWEYLHKADSESC